MKDINLKVGDWVVVMSSDFIDLDIDVSTYEGLPCVILDIKDDKAILRSPLKVCYGKPPADSAPLCQLIKVNKKECERYIKRVMSTDTYDITRNRCK